MIETRYFSADGDISVYRECGRIIRKGGLVAFPTETVYGLGVNALDKDAIPKVFEAKGRPSDNPLIVHVAYPDEAEKIAHVNSTYKRLAERFMPGPLTVILPKKEIVPKEVTGGLDTVGVRCPSDLSAHKLICEANVPIAAPSANLSGAPSPTAAKHVICDMDGRIDAALLSGECSFGLESTVIALKNDGAVILRPGAVTKEELLEELSFVEISPAVTDPAMVGEAPASPGMKYKHYSPKCDFILLDCNSEKFAEFAENQKGRIAVVCGEDESHRFKCCETYIYGRTDDYKALSFSLFAFFRKADERGIEKLYARLPEKEGYGLALYNRMIRAAANRILKV